MPLKVSSQGWVKVPAPKTKTRRRYDPEEEKEALCAPLRYFACQGIDPSRERLRMLGGRGAMGGSQVDLYRPHSRLERSSTLDEWRFDTYTPRSSSRQSGDGFESPIPSTHNNHRSSESDLRARIHEDSMLQGSQARRSSRQRVSSAPVIQNVSPPASVYSEENVAEDTEDADKYADNVSVAYSETPSERMCKHKHRHRKPRERPMTIPEEAELVTNSMPTASQISTSTCSGSCTRQHIAENTSHSVHNSTPATSGLPPVSESTRVKSERTSKSRASRSSKPSLSYRLHDEASETSSTSSYTASERSASPVRDHHGHDYKYKERERYPSPPPSPRLSAHRSRYEPRPSDSSSHSYRNRAATAPATAPRSSAPSASSYGSRSTAPSMDGYQFQAAIFQPKGYQGYRAPSLSKGNRWETATSALSFD